MKISKKPYPRYGDTGIYIEKFDTDNIYKENTVIFYAWG